MGTMSILTVLSIVLVIENSAWAKNMALETNYITDQIVSTTINFIFDIFLKHYTKKLIEENKTQIAIEDFEQSFLIKILSLDIKGAIIASDGWVSNISTIHRTGDADMDRSGGQTLLSAHLGLNELKIDFNTYDISLLGEHQKGKIHVTVGDNSLWLKLSVKARPCSIVLTDLKIEKMEDIKVEITNLGVFENLTDDVCSWIVNEITKRYRGYVEKTVLPELSKAIEDADLCRYWPL